MKILWARSARGRGNRWHVQVPDRPGVSVCGREIGDPIESLKAYPAEACDQCWERSLKTEALDGGTKAQ